MAILIRFSESLINSVHNN